MTKSHAKMYIIDNCDRCSLFVFFSMLVSMVVVLVYDPLCLSSSSSSSSLPLHTPSIPTHIATC